MTLRLDVDTARFDDHVERFAERVGDGLIPVVKGNGYGFGRVRLAARAARLADEIAVGTVHELDVAGTAVSTIDVLTPVGSLVEELPDPGRAVLQVAHPRDLARLHRLGWKGRISVKVVSSMRRFGLAVDDVDTVVAAAGAAGMSVHACTLHLPLPAVGFDDVGELEHVLRQLDPGLAVSCSHLTPEQLGELRGRHPRRDLRLRVGTHLWHGDKSFLHLGADVSEVRPVARNELAGYRRTRVGIDSNLVMIAAGTAQGVAPLPDGRSPFHHRRQRMPLLEPPHMHTSMVVLGLGREAPEPGEIVDVQRPLSLVQPDEVVWH